MPHLEDAGKAAAGAAGEGAGAMIELDDIVSNHKLVCIYCGDLLTLDNYSGWEAFISDGRTTQPVCSYCMLVSDCCTEKEKDR
jgi:hypothetical protein